MSGLFGPQSSIVHGWGWDGRAPAQPKGKIAYTCLRVSPARLAATTYTACPNNHESHACTTLCAPLVFLPAVHQPESSCGGGGAAAHTGGASTGTCAIHHPRDQIQLRVQVAFLLDVGGCMVTVPEKLSTIVHYVSYWFIVLLVVAAGSESENCYTCVRCDQIVTMSPQPNKLCARCVVVKTPAILCV